VITNKDKNSYLKEFFNHNLLREFRLLTENKKFNKSSFIELGHKENLFLSKINEFITKTHNKGKFDVYSHIYPFINWDNLKKYRIQQKSKKKKLHDFSNDKPLRLYDRLFFDFDVDEKAEPELYPIAKELKTRIKESVFTNEPETKKELMKQYHELLLNNELALKPLKELRILIDFLNNKKIKSYPCFSGSKGFHLYIFFQPCLFNHDSFNSIAYSYFEFFRDKLKLETLDENVFNNPSERISRPPYFKHNTTELYTYPIDINDSYKTIIKKSFNPKNLPLHIKDHTDHQANLNLLNEIKELIQKEDLKQKELAKEKKKLQKLQRQRELQRAKQYTKQGRQYKEVEKDCIRIANEFLGSPAGNYGNYVTYQCPWHNDNKPSLSVYKERFYCGVCGFSLNYLGFIMKYHGVDEKEAMKILLSHF